VVDLPGRVLELLQEAGDVQQLCAALLDSAEPLNDDQQRDVVKIVRAAERLSKLVTEMAGFLENNSPEIRTLSHELRTPIVGIRGFAELLLIDLGDPLSNKQRHYLTQINDCGKKLGGLVDDMMNDAAPWPDA
jgi:nitrogen-specific signal transduction histidine kinase